MHDQKHITASSVLNRRDFLATMGITYSALTVPWQEADTAENKQPISRARQGATIAKPICSPRN